MTVADLVRFFFTFIVIIPLSNALIAASIKMRIVAEKKEIFSSIQISDIYT